ncbi:MAG TPA: glycerol-3-phosphate dehydrogenase/oxidase [Planctomycetaceae bacterium]|jgi:glycerol-3-phosphate dehydrogenase|nr:glycerol-3-phosphate dehydrogenase/oxidase [Planctomycetaceae bacterium]
MKRRRADILAGLSATTYDVLIVGGGITGAGVVRDAAGRGLRCLLVEKQDFASGTSSKSGKLIHGGLRYLKYRQWRLVLEACHERWLLQTKIAPHLVRPIRFVVPTYVTSRTPRWMLALGLLAYELLSLGRNAGHFRVLSPRKLAALEPALDRGACRGGVSYFDCACLDCRLVIETLKSAEDQGADLLNYVELCATPVAAKNSIFESTVRDGLTNEIHRVRSRAVINAAGPWADEVQSRLGNAKRFGLKLAIGVHLVIARERLPVRNTVALEVPGDGRMIYAIPWDQHVLVGTTDTFYAGDLDALPVRPEAIDYLLVGVNRYFPEARLTADDILGTFAGARPLLESGEGVEEDAVSRDDRLLNPAPGLWAITGGKLTTYRAMAKRVVDALVHERFGDRTLRRGSTVAPLPGARQPLPPDASPRLTELWSRYGSRARLIEDRIKNSPELGDPIDPRAPFLWGEVDYVLEHEFVERMHDLLDRRLGAFLLAPECDLAPKIANWLIAHNRASLMPEVLKDAPVSELTP